MKIKRSHEQMLDRKRFLLNQTFSTNEKLSKVDQLMASEQTYQTHLHYQYKKLSEQLFLLNNDVFTLRQREHEYEIANSASSNQLGHMKNHLAKFDQQLLKQQELIYHQDFTKETIERRVNRLVGEKSNEKSPESDLKLRELRKEFETKKTHHDQLELQMKVSHDELRVLKREFDQLSKEKSEYHEKFLQLDLNMSSCDKALKRLTRDKEVDACLTSST